MPNFSTAVEVSQTIARNEASRTHYAEVTPEHLFYGVAKLEDCLFQGEINKLDLSPQSVKSFLDEIEQVIHLFRNFELDFRRARKLIRNLLGDGEAIFDQERTYIPKSAKCRSIIERAVSISKGTQSSQTAIQHLLIALLEDVNSNPYKLLTDIDIDVQALADALIELPFPPKDHSGLLKLTIQFRYKTEPEKTFYCLSDEVIIGRTTDSVVHLDLAVDTMVSRRHARLFQKDEMWWLQDLESKYGTFLNDTRIEGSSALWPNDTITVGQTVLRLDFSLTRDETNAQGKIIQHTAIDNVKESPAVSEDKRVEILAKIALTVAHSGGNAMLESLLREVGMAFPQSDRRTIAIIDDNELIPQVFWPPDQSRMSFTLAQQAIKAKEAICWLRDLAPENNRSASLEGATAALYAPFLANGRVIGIIHLDSTSPGSLFSDGDLQLFRVIANTVGSAISATTPDVIRRFPSVFISYSHNDRDFVDWLAATLRRQRVRVWFDERLRSGEAWRRQLATAIENTDVFVLVMSPLSVESEYVQWELDTAASFGKPIIPIMYQKCEIPKTIISLQYLAVQTRNSESLDSLVSELYRLKNA